VSSIYQPGERGIKKFVELKVNTLMFVLARKEKAET